MHLPMGKMNEIHAQFRINEKSHVQPLCKLFFIKGKENIIKGSEHLYYILEDFLRGKNSRF